MMLLSGVDTADFKFVQSALRLTKGNLSSHMARLEAAGYVEVTKSFEGKIPHTDYRLTREGRSRLKAYWQTLEDIRLLAQ